MKFGFTLIELLIVVAIIAILAAIAIPNFMAAQTRSKVSRVKTDLRSLATGLEAYITDNNVSCPACVAPDGFQYDFGEPTPINPRIQRLVWLTTPIAYISSVPNDPFGPGKNEHGDDPDQRRALNYRYPVYTYWDEEFCDVLKEQNPESWVDFPLEVHQRKFWVVFSNGPDRDLEAATGGWPPILICYDPTNGTNSNGDIWYFRGGNIR